MAEVGYAPGSAGFRRVGLALFLAGLATFAMIHCTQPLLPLLAAGFGLTPAASALSLSATTGALGLALLAIGPLADSLARTALMRGSILASAALTLGAALAPGWPLLVAVRAAVGVVSAGILAVAVAYLREEVRADAGARAVGLYIGGTGIGGMTGRLLAGFAADLFGWRGGIVATGLLGLACAVAVSLLLPPSRGFTPQPLRLGVVMDRMRRALTSPTLLALDLIGFASMGSLVASFNALAFRLQGPPYRISAGVLGLIFCVYALGSVASARAGRLADRRGPRPVVAVALVLAVAGELVTLARPLLLIIVGIALVTVGFFACHGVASGWVGAAAGRAGTGPAQASALYLFAYYAGASVVGALAGLAWSWGGWPAVVGLTAGLFALGLAAVLPLRSPDARTGDTAGAGSVAG